MGETKPRKAKKSETLEVRLPFETKRDFLDACREDGTTASEVVRQSIDTYLDARVAAEPPDRKILTMIPKPMRNPRVLAGAAGAIGLAVFVALPSAAGPDLRSAFERLDADKNGVLTDDEFFAGRSGANETSKVVIIERKGEAGSPAAPPAGAAPGVKEEAVTFFLGDEESPSGDGERKQIQMVQRHEVIVSNDGKAPDHAFPADFRKREFGQFDADGDGKVSFVEYETRQKSMLVNGFNMLDEDKDGALSAAEYAKIGAPMVMKLTTGAPGVSAETLETISKAVPLQSEDEMKARFAKLDKNADGKVSLTEYLP